MSTQHIPHNLDTIFEAFANEHRRDIVYLLSLHPHSINQLAAARELSLPAIHKHIKVLKKAEVVIEKKIGRIHFLTINRNALHALQEWLTQYNPHWGSNEESLENYAQYLNKEKKGGEEKI